MTNKNPNRRPSNGSRPARASDPSPRRGFLDGLFPARPAGGPVMMGFGASFSRAAALVFSTPWLLVGVALVLLVEWAVMLGLGAETTMRILAGAFAPPGVGTAFDSRIRDMLFDITPMGQAAILGVIMVRAALHALVATIGIERLRTGKVTRWALRRAWHVLPVTAAANLMGLSLNLVGNILALFLGGTLALFLFVGSLALALYLTAAAPAIAADEDRRVAETLLRAVRSARLPGSHNLTIAVLITLVSFIGMNVYEVGGIISANPSWSEWLITVAFNLFSVIVLVAFAIRYLSVGGEVPDGPPPRREPAPRSRR